ncbi:hypothetical protein [Scytonema millei]|uniref:Uncharacterized protein n=1 Tax=Scytonema millei VB511283 TaxID=1245923 RepID=A0A9X5I8A6_9CYAN|nr:hypothetical protein [Scytonema millei]NHC37907.1 hypothetical protein [Scytonema millei VB511283]
MIRKIQTCPCCDNAVLRHIRHGKVYWFCTHCRQEIPILGIERTPVETSISEAIALGQPSVKA